MLGFGQNGNVLLGFYFSSDHFGASKLKKSII
jgi:hypothetical protein